jgi:uncharacterized protein (TIGR03435 family)
MRHTLPIGLTVAWVLAAQEPAFNAASVRLADETTIMGSRGGPGTSDPGRITYGHIDLILLLAKAYGMQRDQIVGPAATRNGNGQGYSVVATMPRNTTEEQFRLMLQSLLAERFHLALHHETRSFPGYELAVAPGGSKLGAAIHEEPTLPEVYAQIATNTPLKKDDKGFPALPPGLPWRFVSPRLGTVGMIRARFHATITQLLINLPHMIVESDLSPAGSAPAPRVLDRTGLTGIYDFTVEYMGGALFPAGSQMSTLLAQQVTGIETPAVPVGGGGGGPTLATAFEKQLGLTLKKVKDVPVDMIVVDRADKIPADN